MCVALDPDLLGFRSVSLAARYRTAASSNTLTEGLEKIMAARGYDWAPIFAPSSDWEEKFLTPSMAHSTVETFNAVRCLDHSGKLDESPPESATSVLREQICEQGFAGQSTYVRPEFLDLSDAFELRGFCIT